MERAIHYSIRKPKPETNILILIIKYLVLGISSVIGLAFIIPFLIPIDIFTTGQSSEDRWSIYLIVLGIVVAFVFTRHFLRKFKLSKIYDIKIDNINNHIEFKAINNINGKEVRRSISFENLEVDFEINNHVLYGIQRKIILYENHKLYNVIQIDLDGWNRMKNVDKMIENILKLDSDFGNKIESD